MDKLLEGIKNTVTSFSKDDMFELLRVIRIPECQKLMKGDFDPAAIQKVRDVLSPTKRMPAEITALLYLAKVTV